MTLAVSYLRFSSSKQQHGSSIERQQDLLNNYLITNPHLKLHSQSYQDLGLSAYHNKQMNGDLGTFLEAVNAGVYPVGTILLVEAIDRLGRTNAASMLHTLTGIINAGISIVTLEDGMTYNTQSLNGGELYVFVGKVQQAHQYSDKLSQRITASWNIKKKNAKEHGVRPIMQFPFWLDKEGELKPEYQPLLEQMFNDYLSGLGQTRIAERLRLDKSGLLPAITAKTVKKNLANEMVIGLWNEAEVFPKAISTTLFYQVQQELKKRSFTPVVTPRDLFFSGIAKCKCGSNLSFAKDFRRGYVNSRCNRRMRRKEACDNNRSIAYKIYEYIHEQCSFNWKYLLSEHQQQSDNDSELQALDGRITALKAKINKVADIIIDTPSKALGERLTAFESELDDLVKKRHALTVEATLAPDFLTDDEDTLLEDSTLLQAALVKCGYEIVSHTDGSLTVTIDGVTYSYSVLKGFKKNGVSAYKTRLVDDGLNICTWL